MSMKIGNVVVALAIFLTAGSAPAHHSFGLQFDSSRTVTITGILTNVEWTNPHIGLSVDVKPETGPVEDWLVAGSPPHHFLRSDFSKDDFDVAIGQTVTLVVYPARDGTYWGHLLTFTLPDGRSMTVNPSL